MLEADSPRDTHGFVAAQRPRVLEQLPAWWWPEARRKQSYVNHVLARAEVKSTYAPARKLWVRTRYGQSLPNPALLLRAGDSWQPLTSQFAIDWIDLGRKTSTLPMPGPAESFQLAESVAAAPDLKRRTRPAS